VVLISIDTLRADRLPAYGYAQVETPHLERLRRDAVVFENAYTHVPLTLPAHASLFTGQLPPEHQVRDNLGYTVDAKTPLMASLLKAHGYTTGAAVSAYVLRSATGIARGFDFYDDKIEAPPGVDAAGSVQRAGDDTARRALDWLSGVAQQPFFLFLHLYEPHSPFDPPEPFKTRYAGRPYDGEVATADLIVGRFLDELRARGLYERALVIVLSDHGEGLGDHGEEFHGILLYREVLHVPLLVKLPGSARAGTRVATPVELVDVLPTLLSLVGAQAPAPLRGQSLFAPQRAARRIYAETYYPRVHLGWSELRAVVDERWHYIDGPRPELYDVRADPAQRNDLAERERTQVRSLRKALGDFPSGFAGPASVSRQDLEKLSALGYLGGGSDAPAGPLPNPRDNIHVLDDVKRGFALKHAGQLVEAVRVFEGILEHTPHFLDVRYQLGQTLAELGRHQEAYDAYRAALRASPALAGPLSLALARTALELGRIDEAATAAQAGQATNAAESHEILARVALARGDLDTLAHELDAVRGDERAELNARVLRAELYIRRERFQDALRELDQAQQRLDATGRPPLRDVDFLRGDALARLSRFDEAEAAFRREVARFPRNTQAYARLAIVMGIRHRTFGEVDRLLDAMYQANPIPQTAAVAAETLDSMGDRRGAAAWRRRASGAQSGTRRPR
jgi:arylsulfatase A-like enzyme/Flp pilus assembly protein TadD